MQIYSTLLRTARSKSRMPTTTSSIRTWVRRLTPYMFTTKASGAGVVYGALAGGRYEVTVAKGMDAGLAALASFCPQLLEDEGCRDAR